MRALVTGGAGAIGSHVVDALLARGDRVAIVDSFHDFYPRVNKERNLAGILGHAGFHRLYEVDIRDAAGVAGAFEDFSPDTVVHLAARAGVRPSVDAAVEYADVNLNGTAVVLDASMKARVERFFFASSSTVYGEGATSPFEEDGDTSRPVSPYGATKRGGELLCYAAQRGRDLQMTCARFFSVYGPRQRPDLATACWAQAMREGRPIPVFGDGSVERDFTFISDIVDGILRALERPAGFRIYNLGRGQPFSMNQVIALLEQAMGVPAERDVRPAHPADLARTCASIDRARDELGYEPKVSLEDGIRSYVDWLTNGDEG